MAGPNNEGHEKVDETTKTSSSGDIAHYEVYEDDEGNTYEEYVGGATRNEILGFEDDDHFEDNMF